MTPLLTPLAYVMPLCLGSTLASLTTLSQASSLKCWFSILGPFLLSICKLCGIWPIAQHDVWHILALKQYTKQMNK